MANTPKEELRTRQELATALDVHPMTITGWQEEGMPVASRGGRGIPSLYNEVEVRAWLVQREEAARALTNGKLDPVQERATKEHWQALIAEQTFLVRAKKLLPADEVARLWRLEVAAVRALILTSYTTHSDIVFRAATQKGLAGVEIELKRLAHEILNELAKPDRPLPDPATDAPVAKPKKARAVRRIKKRAKKVAA